MSAAPEILLETPETPTTPEQPPEPSPEQPPPPPPESDPNPDEPVEPQPESVTPLERTWKSGSNLSLAAEFLRQSARAA